MLSICIPVYNENVVELVNSLVQQCDKEAIGYEILLADDCSGQKYRDINISLGNLAGVSYLLFDENVGYTQNRNRLVEVSKYDNLLFLDADMALIDTHYLITILSHLGKYDVVCGGIKYEEKEPEDDLLKLKWRHGKQFEERGVSFREKNPYVSFTAANFLIKKEVIAKIPLDSTSLGYGYNDTMYGYRLMKEGFRIHHIDNPVYHMGVIGREKFISRIKESVVNLINFEKQDYVDHETFYSFIRLLRGYEKLGVFRLPVFLLLKLFKGKMLNGLRSKSPSPKNLNLLKLYYLIGLKLGVKVD